MAISKDEEEVAETLFALAGMIPLDSLPVNKRTDNKSLQAKTSDLSKKQHSNSTPSEGLDLYQPFVAISGEFYAAVFSGS